MQVQDMQPLQPKEEVQLVVFNLGREEYAVEIHEVREIIKREKITPVPNAPSFVEGIINLRGKIVVVINLMKRFGMIGEGEELEQTHIVILEINGNNFGILVDGVSEVLKIENESIKETPEIIASKIHKEYLSGVGIVGERLLILLNLNTILSAKDLMQVAEITKEMKPRAEKPKEKKQTLTSEDVENRFKKHFEERESLKEDGASKAVGKNAGSKKYWETNKDNIGASKIAAKINPFVTKKGDSIKSLPELKTHLESISKEEFEHHVTPEKNDFSNWIHAELKEPELADKIRKSKVKQAIKAINTSLKSKVIGKEEKNKKESSKKA